MAAVAQRRAVHLDHTSSQLHVHQVCIPHDGQSRAVDGVDDMVANQRLRSQ